MARRAKPWYRRGRGWFVWFHGQQINLETHDREEAERRFGLLRATGERPESKPPTAEPPKAALTVIGLLGLFLASIERNRKPLTLDWYRRYCRAFAKAISPTLLASELKPYHLTDWTDKAYPLHSRRAPLAAIKAATAWAYQSGRIEVDPLNRVKLPPKRTRKGTVTKEQREKLYAAVQGTSKRHRVWRDILIALEQTGCRVQELRALEARHVLYHDGRPVAWVFPAEERKSGDKIGKPRVIPLTEPIAEVTARLALENPTGALFRNSLGKPITRNMLRNWFRRRRQEDSTLPPNLCGTLFRKAMATDLASAGELEKARQVLGHTGFEVLAKNYLQEIDPRELAKAVKKVR